MRTAPTKFEERLPWIDLLRAIAVLLVLLSHATILMGVTAPRPLLWLTDAVGGYLPTLMFLAGLTVQRSLRHPPARFVERKLRTVVWPWLLWSALLLPVLGWSNATDPLWWVAGARSHTWFLAVLVIQCGLILIPNVPHVVTAASMLTVTLLVHEPTSSFLRYLDGLAWWGFFFFLGAWAGPRIGRIAALPPALAAAGVIASGVWSMYAIKSGATQTSHGPAAALTTVGIFTMVWLAARVPRLDVLRAMEWIGQRSIVLYLVHWPVMLVAVAQLPLAGWTGFIILFTGSLTLSALVAMAWPVTRLLFELPRIGEKDRKPPVIGQPQDPFKTFREHDFASRVVLRTRTSVRPMED